MSFNVNADYPLGQEVTFAVDNECFDPIYAERGGNPFDPISYRNSFYFGYIKKLPHQYPKHSKKSKIKHWTFDLPAFETDTEFEFDEHQIGFDVRISIGTPSTANFILWTDLRELYDNLKKVTNESVENITSGTTSKSNQDALICDSINNDPLPSVELMQESVNNDSVQLEKSFEDICMTTLDTVILDSPEASEFLSPIPNLPSIFKQAGYIYEQETSLMTNTYNKSPALSTRSKITTKGVVPVLNLENEYLTEEENESEEPKEVGFLTQIPYEPHRESLFHLAFWNKSTKKWFAKPSKRLLLPKSIPPPVTKTEMEGWKSKYELEGNIFRDSSVKQPASFPRTDFIGEFQYCGCNLQSCKVNVAGSSHYCRHCKIRMLGFCLVEPGSWGLCYSCYLTTTATKPSNVNTKKAAVSKKLPLQQVTAISKTKTTSDNTPAPAAVSNTGASTQSFAAELDTPSSVSIAAYTANDDNLFKVVIGADGVLVPPKPKEPYVVNELELLSHEPMSTVSEQLWYLLCSLVQSSFSTLLETIEARKPVGEQNKKKKGSPTMTWPDRFQNYATLAEEVIQNYATKETGAFVLGFFYEDDETGKPDWPPSVKRRYYSIKDKGRREYKTWMHKGGKKYFTDADRKNLNEQCKVMVYVGSKIHDAIQEAETMANTHINKHWPYEFKSGQSPAGLLHIIRKWYWQEIEAPKKIKNSLKQWASSEKQRRKSKGKADDNCDSDDSDFVNEDDQNAIISDIPPAEMEAKRIEFLAKNKFHPQLFPDAWLVWYVYGPPKCGGHALFTNTEMLHLTKIKAARKLSEEEEVQELGQANKYARRTAKNVRKHGNSKANKDSDDVTEISETFPTSIKWIREDKPPTAMDQLDRAISTCKEMITLIQETIADDGDPDHEFEDEIKTLKAKLRTLLREKLNECLEDREVLKRKRDD